jgi:hypothetical protein
VALYTKYGSKLQSINVTSYVGPPPYTTSSYYTTNRDSYSEVVSKSDAIKRVKPVDLFTGGTDWFNYRIIRVESTGSISTSNSYLSSTDIFPVSDYIAAGEPGGPSVSPAINELAGKLRSKIKNSNLNLAQTLAEYRQTSSMFSSLSKDLLRTLRSFRRPDQTFASLVRALQRPRSKTELDIANRWLQYQYGIKPLVQDVYGSAEALASKIRTGFYQHIRSSTSRSKDTDEPQANPYLSRWWKKDAQLSAVVRYKISDPALKQLSQLGITNPALLAWELIPYSFVADLIFPIGSWLSSLDSLNGTSDIRVIYSRKETTFMRVTAYGGAMTYKKDTYQRYAPVGNIPLPSFGYKPSKSLVAVANGLALLTQIRKR